MNNILGAETGILERMMVPGVDIRDTDYPEPAWIVPDLLTSGLALSYGPPKVGKSVLNLQLARAVAGGGFFLGQKCEQGKVLYLALEDHLRRMKARMGKQGWYDEAYKNIWVISQGSGLTKVAGYINNGLADAIEEAIRDHGFRLITIDILGKIFQGDLNEYGEVIKGLEPIQKIAGETNACVMLVHHSRKRGTMADDFIEGALGSIGITGSVDTVWRLTPDGSTARQSVLEVTGRDLNEAQIDITLCQDEETMTWVVADEDAPTDNEQAVLDILAKSGEPLRQTDIAARLDKPDKSVSRWLDKLYDKALVYKEDRRGGKYWRLETRREKPLF